MWVFVANSKENLIRGVAAAESIITKGTVMSGKFKKQKSQELKQNWREKKMHGQFVREMRIKLGNGYSKVI